MTIQRLEELFAQNQAQLNKLIEISNQANQEALKTQGRMALLQELYAETKQSEENPASSTDSGQPTDVVEVPSASFELVEGSGQPTRNQNVTTGS